MIKKWLNSAFEGFKHLKVLPFWQNGGDELVEHLHSQKIPFMEWNSFFESEGEDLYALVKSLTFQRMQEDDYAKMTDVQKGMLGAYILKEAMKQLAIEVVVINKKNEKE